jgi:hypothetical protein
MLLRVKGLIHYLIFGHLLPPFKKILNYQKCVMGVIIIGVTTPRVKSALVRHFLVNHYV